MRFVSVGRLVFAAVVLAAPALAAQAAPLGMAGRLSATRAELDSLAMHADEAAASALRARLRDGDFQVGDRLVLFIRGDSVLSDTFTVDRGRTLSLPDIPTVSLAGVLRSELQSHVAKQLGDFVKDTVLRAKALIQFGVVGEVSRPGYYLLPVDAPINDAIMAAGGLTTRTDLPKSFVRRGRTKLLSKADVRTALVDRLTLEQLNLGAGDELVVGAKRDWGWPTVASLATGAIALLVSMNSR
jgi:protein involved in polysaccharide export with SLBB domain